MVNNLNVNGLIIDINKTMEKKEKMKVLNVFIQYTFLPFRDIALLVSVEAPVSVRNPGYFLNQEKILHGVTLSKWLIAGFFCCRKLAVFTY